MLGTKRNATQFRKEAHPTSDELKPEIQHELFLYYQDGLKYFLKLLRDTNI